MKISTYTELIKRLPYKQQSFKTTRETWKAFKDNLIFKPFYEKTFVDESKIISRDDLFGINKNNFLDGIFSIVFWGYSKGYTRGNTMNKLFPLFLDGLPVLQNELIAKDNFTNGDLKRIIKNVNGVGLSTLTKFLYFFNLSVENNKSLILDSRIMNVLKNKKFEELNALQYITESNKTELYPEYLRLMNEISEKYHYEADRLELFLYMFGNNLKNRSD